MARKLQLYVQEMRHPGLINVMISEMHYPGMIHGMISEMHHRGMINGMVNEMRCSRLIIWQPLEHMMLPKTLNSGIIP